MPYSSLSNEELIRACAESGTPAAWEEFVRRFQPLIARVALRTAQRWGEAHAAPLDDLVQEAFLKLCAGQGRLLREFESRHPNAIFGYIKIVTANVVHDHFRPAHVRQRKEQAEPGGHPPEDPAAPGGAQTIEREVLLREVDACLCEHAQGKHSLRDRLVFWLYYRQGLTARAIASLPGMGLSTKGVESVLQRLTRLVREALGRKEFKP